MEQEKKRFGAAVIVGFLVMFLFALVTVNLLNLIPLAGPFIGGLVAGLIAGKDFLNGGKAGVMSGWLGAVVISLDLMMNTGYFSMAVPQLPQAAGVLFLIVAIFYFPILGFIGGAIGGTVRH